MGMQRAVDTRIGRDLQSTAMGSGSPASMLSQADLMTGYGFLQRQGVSQTGSQQFWQGQTVTSFRDRAVIDNLIRELEPVIATHDRPGVNNLTYRGMVLSRTLLEVGGVAADKFIADAGHAAGAVRR